VPFHFARHACVSWLLGAGMDVVAVSGWQGHRSPTLTFVDLRARDPGRQGELAKSIGAALR